MEREKGKKVHSGKKEMKGKGWLSLNFGLQNPPLRTWNPHLFIGVGRGTFGLH
jgi:hypothetical protein